MENTKFYDNFGIRLKFIRLARRLTLSELSSGSASTAQSWESGIYPRTRRWREIADRLGVSEPFLFKGIPVTQQDYEFIQQNRSEIGDPPSSWSSEGDREKVDIHSEPAPPMVVNASIVSDYLRPWFEAMRNNPNVAPYVWGELKKHLPHEDLRLFAGDASQREK